MNWRSTHCPRFDHCNAPICPLDPDWPRSRHLSGEAVCRYLSEMAKDAGSAALLGECDGQMQDKLEQEFLRVVSVHGTVRIALERSAQRPSKLGRRPTQEVHSGKTRDPGQGSSES